MVIRYLPRIEPVSYESVPGDVVYGLRLTVPRWTSHDKHTGDAFAYEVGKISDDELKTRLLSNYIGLADSFYYFKFSTCSQTHLFIASLFLADIITRPEAEAVLSKGPLFSPCPGPSFPLLATIHRLPSLATLAGAYIGGTYVGIELLSLTASLSVAIPIGATTIAVTPVAMGCLAVGGAMVLFSRSSRVRGVGLQVTQQPALDKGGARKRVDSSFVRALTREELERNPIFSDLDRQLSHLLAEKSSSSDSEPDELS